MYRSAFEALTSGFCDTQEDIFAINWNAVKTSKEQTENAKMWIIFAIKCLVNILLRLDCHIVIDKDNQIFIEMVELKKHHQIEVSHCGEIAYVYKGPSCD